MPSVTDRYQMSLVDEVQEIVDYRPHWIVRRGNVLLLLIVLISMAATYFVNYPDVMKASARLFAEDPPKQIVARSQGKLVKLLVSDNERVQSGQHLGYIESTSDYSQVLELANWLEKQVYFTNEGDIEEVVNSDFPILANLGELQANYQQFQNQLAIARQTFSRGYYEQKKDAVQRDLEYLHELRRHAQAQKELQQEDIALQEKEYHAFEQLAKEKVIATLELNQYKSKLLGKAQGLDQLDAQITGIDISSHGKITELLDLQKEIVDCRQQFRSSLLQLKSQVEEWIKLYVLVAADSGRVIFASTLIENQLITIGQPIFYIQSDNSTYYLELMVSHRGFGKIRDGQKVIVHVDGFPSDEFGTLLATISYISPIPGRTDSFSLKASLPNGLNTSYGKSILFTNSLSAKADIITANRRLIHRFAGRLKDVFYR